ncbi:terminase small subunit [Candidatus Francisella endociliophora]|uniref:terminase small subunit n=1 Tax=Candidatus Francisella endociliophora TaxID=653937 RepID=UPI000694FA3F|nr:terminase small subunit [Francisella sp. FSC1006]
MSKLTPQQELFCQEYVKCGNATQSYKKAYPKAEKWKESAVWSKSSELLANGKVSERVKELKQQLQNSNLWTRERSVKILAQIAEYDFQTQTDRINAVKELNKMHGYDAPVEQSESKLEYKIILTDETK